MRFETLAGLLEESGRGCDILIGEGVMGLFDGAADGTGSTADIAALFGLPVLLVVDVTGMGASVAALIDGFRRHREDVEVIGVLLNRVASPAHVELLSRACFEHVSTPVLGMHPARLPALRAAQPASGPGPGGRASGPHRLPRPPLPTSSRRGSISSGSSAWRALPACRCWGQTPRPLPPLGQRIAVARDRAFAFAYAAVLDGWRRQGVELLPFSPLADEPPDATADAVFLPGGYPELHPAALAGNSSLHGRHCAPRPNAAPSSTANAAATWRWDAPWSIATAPATRWPACCRWSRASPSPSCISATARSSCSAPARWAGWVPPFAGTSSIMPASSSGRDRRCSAPAVPAASDLGDQGCRSGHVAGSFLHLIDRAPGRPPLPRSA